MKFNDMSLVKGGALAEGSARERVKGTAMTAAASDGEAPGHGGSFDSFIRYHSSPSSGIIRDPFT